MDDNPYRSPQQAAPQRKANPLLVGALSVLAIVVAADLLIGGVIKTFVWGVVDKSYPQMAYGVISLLVGALILERLAQYLRTLNQPKRQSRSAGLGAVTLIWFVILLGVGLELVSLLLALI